MSATRSKRSLISWALYDWANSAFATTVMAVFFPIFFQKYWGEGSLPEDNTARLGIASAVASLVVAAGAPFLGAIADHVGAKKRFLMFFALMGVVMTGGLYFVAQGGWFMAAALFMLATIGFSGGNVFYDALIVSVSDEEHIDFASALGFSIGYLGGGLLLILNTLMVENPGWFGLEDAGHAVRASFLTVSVWWAVFAIPIFLFVDEPEMEENLGIVGAMKAGAAQLKHTFHKLKQLKVVGTFLLGYWFYIDGVDTVIRMATDYGSRLNLDSGAMIKALLMTQFIGFPAAIAFGKFGEKVGAKRAIFVGIAVYLAVVVFGAFVDNETDFYILAGVVGLVQGGVQSLSRSLYTRLIPASQSAEFFGFYNMLGKFAAVLGPTLMAAVSLLTPNPRVPLISLAILFVIGAGILARVDEEEGARMADALQ